MVASNVLEPTFNSGEFWKGFARKFTSAQAYDMRKKRAADTELVQEYYINKFNIAYSHSLFFL